MGDAMQFAAVNRFRDRRALPPALLALTVVTGVVDGVWHWDTFSWPI
jgi:hypothetical protein